MRTLKQTGKAVPIPILLVDEDYWRRVVNFEHLRSMGMVAEEDLRIFEFASDAEAAWSILEQHKVTVPPRPSLPEQISKPAL